MLKITIESTELIINYKNIPDELRTTFKRLLNRCKGLSIDKSNSSDNVWIVSGEQQHLYACLFNFAIIFDIELW